jgi:hypothetical protein
VTVPVGDEEGGSPDFGAAALLEHMLDDLDGLAVAGNLLSPAESPQRGDSAEERIAESSAPRMSPLNGPINAQ